MTNSNESPQKPKDLPPAQKRLLDLETVRAEKARRSLRVFAEQAWHVVEPITPFCDGWHIGCVCEHLEAVTAGQIENLLLSIPPGHMKSLLVSVMWLPYIWATFPETRFLAGARSQDLAERDSRRTRNVLQSPWYQRQWGHKFRFAEDQNEKGRFENDKTGYRIAVSIGGGVTGERGDFTVVDDPHDAIKVQSDAEREKVIHWYDDAFWNRVTPEHHGRVVQGQRVHHKDLIGHLVEQGGWVHVSLPAEYEPTEFVSVTGWKDPRTEEGEILWPEKVSAADLEAAKIVHGPMGYAAQYQQRPVPAEGGMVKRDWFKFRYYKALPAKFDQVIITFDCAFKGLNDSDFVCGQVWGKVGAEAYLFPGWIKDHLDFPATIAAVRTLWKAWPQAREKIIEDKANGPAVIQTLSKEIPGMLAKDLPGGKVAALYSVTPYMAAGNVWLPDPTIESRIEDYIAELLAFPRGAHDDQVDATSLALLHFYGGQQIVIYGGQAQADEPPPRKPDEKITPEEWKQMSGAGFGSVNPVRPRLR